MPRATRPSYVRRLLQSKVAWFVCGVVVLVALVSFGREYYRRQEVRRDITRLEDRAKALEERQTNLTNLIEYFESPLFQEQEAREKLGLAKPGESVVVVPLGGQAAEGSIDEQSTAATEEGTNPVHWWNYFFSNP